MSSQALNWVMESVRTDCGAAQAILLVIADGAGPDCVSRELNPDEIAERSCQSRSTVFKRLGEMRHFGVLDWKVNSRGEYTFTLYRHRRINYDRKMLEAMREQHRQEVEAAQGTPGGESVVRTESEIESVLRTESEFESENESNCSDSHIDSKKEKKERVGGGGVARARADDDDMAEAVELAERIASIAGHPNPKHWPAGWCGTSLTVRAMLAEGYDPALMLATAQSLMAQKPKPEPYSIRYFVKAFARAHALSQTPLPNVTVHEREELHVTRPAGTKETLGETCDRMAREGFRIGPRPKPVCAGEGEDDPGPVPKRTSH